MAQQPDPTSNSIDAFNNFRNVVRREIRASVEKRHQKQLTESNEKNEDLTQRCERLERLVHEIDVAAAEAHARDQEQGDEICSLRDALQENGEMIQGLNQKVGVLKHRNGVLSQTLAQHVGLINRLQGSLQAEKQKCEVLRHAISMHAEHINSAEVMAAMKVDK
jgi:chromosome segregation ATPase